MSFDEILGLNSCRFFNFLNVPGIPHHTQTVLTTRDRIVYVRPTIYIYTSRRRIIINNARFPLGFVKDLNIPGGVASSKGRTQEVRSFVRSSSYQPLLVRNHPAKTGSTG